MANDIKQVINKLLNLYLTGLMLIARWISREIVVVGIMSLTKAPITKLFIIMKAKIRLSSFQRKKNESFLANSLRFPFR